jgi:penicillin-binding protein
MKEEVEENMHNFFAKFNQPWIRGTLKVTWFTFKWTLICLLIGGLFAGSAAFGFVTALVKDDQIRSRDMIMTKMQENAITGFVYFNKDDEVVGQLRTEEDRRLATLGEIPQLVLDATFAIEDKNFYNHNGVDINGITRAVKQKVLNEDVQTGGSTITQQLARRVFLTLDRDEGRKAKEILLSLRLERLMSKDEILLAYLNKIPYGNGSTGYNLFGIKAAAKGIFDIDDLNKLNVAQAAYLVGLPQQPSNYSAFTSSGNIDGAALKRAITRQQLVLERMLEEAKITKQQYDEALAFDIKSSLAKPQEKAYNTYPFLMIEAEKQATETLMKVKYPNLDPVANKAQYAEALKDIQSQLLRGGYHIYTTIDKTIYDAMHVIAENEKNFTATNAKAGLEQVGSVMLDSKTGAILGMIEGRQFGKEQLNHATQMVRQPGSTMKPVAAFLPALEKGLIQPGSIIDDSPLVLKDGQKGYHLPENHNNKFQGLITAREALNQSYNIPALKIFLEKVGIQNAWDFARKLGITTLDKKDDTAQTGVIGGLTYGTSVKELTGAYASIPNKGVFNQTFMIRKITDSNGEVIYMHELKPAVVYSEETSYLMTDMLRTVVANGTGYRLNSLVNFTKKTSFVGKTGSTQDDADAWFMGFTPDITLGVWAGYDQPINKLTTGGKARAMSIWALVMNKAVELKPELFPTKEFTKPANIVSMTVSSVSGKIPSDLNIQEKKTVTDIFNRKYIPNEQDSSMVKMKYVTFKNQNYVPNPATPMEFTQEKILVKREKPLDQLFKEIEKVPEAKRKPLDFYKPLDFALDAPSEADPRVDDGKEPSAPISVLATSSGDIATITFGPSTSEDVVGYRIYSSENGGPYQLIPAAVVLTGQETKFLLPVNQGSHYAFYLTAVDVVGKESTPSNAADTTGATTNPPDLPGVGNPNAAEVPAAPVGLQLNPMDIGVKISWNANAAKDGVIRYVVYYSTDPNRNFKQVATVPAPNTEHFHTSPFIAGYYKVAAENSKGISAPSAAVQLRQ